MLYLIVMRLEEMNNKKGTLSSAQTELKGGDSMCSTLSKVVDFFAGFTICARAII